MKSVASPEGGGLLAAGGLIARLLLCWWGRAISRRPLKAAGRAPGASSGPRAVGAWLATPLASQLNSAYGENGSKRAFYGLLMLKICGVDLPLGLKLLACAPVCTRTQFLSAIYRFAFSLHTCMPLAPQVVQQALGRQFLPG